MKPSLPNLNFKLPDRSEPGVYLCRGKGFFIGRYPAGMFTNPAEALTADGTWKPEPDTYQETTVEATAFAMSVGVMPLDLSDEIKLLKEAERQRALAVKSFDMKINPVLDRLFQAEKYDEAVEFARNLPVELDQMRMGAIQKAISYREAAAQEPT